MSSKTPVLDPVAGTLNSILATLQDLLILEGARAGITRDDLRRIVGVSNERVSAVMRHIRSTKNVSD
jgi:DNA-binding transcriptional regulator GbsR (MarR family)